MLEAEIPCEMEGGWEDNTVFFHHCVNSRSKVNSMQMLMIEGVECRDQAAIESHVIDFFHHLYSSDCLNYPTLDGMGFDQLDSE
ncbi:hypothetical protein FRX31_016153, partial [Thalictrum thalictroides]